MSDIHIKKDNNKKNVEMAEVIRLRNCRRAYRAPGNQLMKSINDLLQNINF